MLRILSPAMLKSMDLVALGSLCKQLRSELVETIPAIGGHFASSLGVVELSVILHHLFECPKDTLVWDVGHQAYVHKMLTARGPLLHTIRKQGGVSGFLKRSESEFDSFGAGHAGTSVSAALGMRLAQPFSQNAKYVVSIIGDGSLTTGMAFEALNNAGGIAKQQPERLQGFIVIVNDNGMSISDNVGALHQSSPDSEHPLVAYSRALGFDYHGPIDGHDLEKLKTAIVEAKRRKSPVLLHLRTIKGKGFIQAELDPIAWHGVAPLSSPKNSAPSFTEEFSRSLAKLMKADSRITAITAAMPGGCGLDAIQRQFPDRVFDVGICEQHAVTLAAGMAAAGLRPVVAVYSTFLQRALDQVIHDVCIQNLPVIFAIDRAGLVGADGETHQGVFDISLLRGIPNLSIMSPRNGALLEEMLRLSLDHGGPTAIRYPRGESQADEMVMASGLKFGTAEKLRSGTDALILALGPSAQAALRVADRAARELNLSIAVMDARFVKPLDTTLLSKELTNYPLVCTLEDHALKGGFGSAVIEWINDVGLNLRTAVKRFGVPDSFVSHATQEEQKRVCGFDEEGIFSYLRERLILHGPQVSPRCLQTSLQAPPFDEQRLGILGV